MACDCEFAADPADPDEDTPEKSFHYRRICPTTGNTWFSLHCEHDGYQKPCLCCGEYHRTPIGAGEA